MLLRLAPVLCFCLLSSTAAAQSFSSRGFADARLFLFPQDAPNDPTNAVGEALVRYEPSWKATSWLRLNGAFDARIDTHDQVERRWFVDWKDRGLQRPPFSVRRASAVVSRAGLSVEIGKQFIRWGKADVLNPTDRFAPRDFLSVVDNDFLGVTGVRGTYEAGPNTIDAVWVPLFTPSRVPLLNQRWTVVPAGFAVFPGVSPAVAPGGQVAVGDAGSRFPGGSQAGARWNRTGAGYEFSLAFYNGHNHLPLIETQFVGLPRPSVLLTRTYPQMRMYGGDFALPNRWVTVKGEFGYFTSTTDQADEYGIYVLQVERQLREWVLVGGYAGDFVTRTGVVPAAQPLPGAVPPASVAFAADRGLARAFLGRASVSLDAGGSFAFQAAVRQNGHGTWLQAEYSRPWGSHVRATLEANLIRGRDDDFLGQFHRNSNLNLAVRYSF